MSKILMVLSAADTWTRADGSKYESGVWAEEFVVMHEKLIAAGIQIDLATPGGVRPTMDPHSMKPEANGDDGAATPLEQAVLDLARNEQGRGLLPTTRLGRTLERISLLFGGQVIRPLADPRLEALRLFVNALHRRGRARIEATATALRSAGFDPLQESWIRSAHLQTA